MLFRFKTKSQELALVLTVCWVLVPFSLSQEEQTSKSSEKDEKGRKVQRVNVVAERFNFTPSQIKVKQGTLLEITLTSDDTFHGFRVPSMQINQVIPARGRGSVKVVFDAKEKGTYSFECSRPCGAGHTMMRGVIVVE
ncbi:MAG: cupredoxin domain-containing protein [Acidobacteria bacterium]|nr:cupredoxin domain-containing protein [Acidobacteriota bacterium]MCI0620882.1 cupredoxin domain-containing protein [Acidobacteriota bacterium]MCI0720346.1 cupredoxin domain-containing protein [Acidobacteriota bacterium]